jgi:hypothetical protein
LPTKVKGKNKKSIDIGMLKNTTNVRNKNIPRNEENATKIHAKKMKKKEEHQKLRRPSGRSGHRFFLASSQKLLPTSNFGLQVNSELHDPRLILGGNNL